MGHQQIWSRAVSRIGQLWAGLTRQRIIRLGGLLGIGLAIALLLNPAAIAQSIRALPPDRSATESVPMPSSELRGVWLTNVDSEVLFSRDNIKDAIRRLERLNFNTVYPTVWNGGYTLYPSPAAEQAIGKAVDPEPAFAGRDMLEDVVEQGHKRKLSVIPWFEFGLMAPADSELVQRHPDWVTTRKNGDSIFINHDKRMVWLTPAHPEVQNLLVSMMIEVITKYDVDGIQLDDHFGMPVDAGYDPYTIDQYKRDHQGQTPPANARDPEWMRWRANQVTNLMIRVYSAIKTRKPNCIISLSPGPQDFSYQAYLQPWGEWTRLNFIDELIVQVYRTDFSRFTNELNRLQSQVSRSRVPVGIGILTGLRVLNVDIDQIERQVKTARDRQFAGVSFFFYETLGDRDDAFQALFPNRASRPSRTYAQS